MRRKTHILLITDLSSRSSLVRAITTGNYKITVIPVSGVKSVFTEPIFHDVAVFVAHASSQELIDAFYSIHISGAHKPIIVVSKTRRIDVLFKSFVGAASGYFVSPVAADAITKCISELCSSATRQDGIERGNRFRISNMDKGALMMDGRSLHLSKAEFNVFAVLLRYIGEPVSRNAIYEAIYGVDGGTKPSIVIVLISKVRKKLSMYGAENCIETRRGQGFLLHGEPSLEKSEPGSFGG